MATSTEIKQRANTLADKTDVNSITPKEVGGIMYDLASHGENVLRNGGTLGIRKVYESVAAMEADSTNPKDFWGDPIKKGNLVVIYDGTTTGVDNNKIYAFMKPGWELATKLDAAYATKAETDAKLSELGSKVKNPIGLPTTKGIMELILMVVDDGVDHVLGIRQIVSATGRLGIADLTSGKNYYISIGEDGFTGGVREYWYKHSYSGYYILLYVKIDWNEVNDIPFTTEEPANTITVRAKQSFSIDGANLVDMLMSCNYDIVGDVVYNSDDIVQSARIKWRDGASGNMVKSNYNSDVLEYNSTTISYNDYIKVVKELEYDALGNIVKESTNINIK